MLSGLGRSAAIAQWEHAIRHLRAAGLAGMEPSIGVKLAYDGALAGCLAVLATYDLKAAGSQGHHEAVFAGVEYTEDPAFANLIIDSSANCSATLGPITRRVDYRLNPLLAHSDT